MAILSDRSIKRYIESGRIKVEPQPLVEQFQPCSLDLRLDNSFLSFEGVGCIDVRERLDYSGVGYFSVDDPLVLEPGDFVLCQTVECVSLPCDVLGRVEGRSSVGRLGVTVHVTAGFIDPGFVGNITLEVCNLNCVPVVLYPGMRVCQLCFEELDCVCECGYDGKYQGQRVPTPSSIFVDVDSE